MAMFNSYVKLPEGNDLIESHRVENMIPDDSIIPKRPMRSVQFTQVTFAHRYGSLARPKAWHNLQYPGPDWIVQLSQFSWCPMMARCTPNISQHFSQSCNKEMVVNMSCLNDGHMFIFCLISFPQSSRHLDRMSYFLNRNMSYLRCLFWETPSIVPFFFW